MKERPITQVIIDMAKAHYEAGGRPAEAAMTPATARKLEAEWKGADEMQIPSSSHEPSRMAIETPHGSILVLVSPYCPPDNIYIGDVGQLRNAVEQTADYFMESA